MRPGLGHLALGGGGLRDLDVAQALAVPNPTTQRVFIRADKDVKYGDFMNVINQLQTDGYFKIGLISEEV